MGKILISALEKSANLHLSHLLPYLSYEPIGIFDKRFGEPIIDLQELAIMGFVDAIKQLPLFLKLKQQMLSLAKEADKVLLIDSSGFNLPLAKAIKKEYPKKEIIYYILPQAWAWRRGRIKVIEKYIDKALSILPFEKQFYSSNYNITYVGHPLLDEIKEFKEEPTTNGPIVYMPGSRRSEITSLMPIFKKLRKAIDKESILVVPSHIKELDIYGDIEGFTISHDPYQALLKSQFAFICSGTATLESALIGTPLALVYKAKKIDFFIAKHLVKLQNVGLANILIPNTHPEFLQEEVNVPNLLRAYHNRDPQSFLNRSKELRRYLGSGSAKRAAEMING